MKTSISILFAAALCVTACDPSKNEAPKPTPEQAPAKPGAPVAQQPAAVASAATASAPVTPTATATNAKPEASKGGPPLFSGVFPDTDSKPPSVQEWKTEAKIYIVKHSSSLVCETSVLREWLRVSCRGKPGQPNQPTGLKVVKAPKKGQHFEFTKEGIASLVMQPRKGQTSEFTFEWSNWGTRTLTVTFPEGSEKPEIYFDKAAPAGKAGLPRCEDVCGVMRIFHNYMSDCAQPCGDGYKCEWWGDGNERTAMCVCSTECAD
ncbi:MAG TPA: hypothetical protein PK156_20995 [Polyangium sp.]|nr:hypothetical protein [Polyangium sp.]